MVTSIFLFGCSANTFEISNKNISEFGETGLSFFVDKNVSYKDELLNAVNEAIEQLNNAGGGISELVNYHNDILDGKTPTLSFELPNLEDNTDGTIVVYSSVDGPPFDYLGENNEVMGMEIDVLKFAAEILNKKIVTRICTFGALVQNIVQESDEWRISGVGVAVTEERLKKVSFTDPYWVMKLNIISKESEGFDSIHNLNGKNIGVYTGESGANYINECKTNGTLSSDTIVTEYTTPQSAFQAFLSEKVDAVVCLDYVADGLIKNNISNAEINGFYKVFIQDGRWKLYLQGLGNSLLVASFGFVISLTVGILLAVCLFYIEKTKKLKPLGYAIEGVVNIIRAVPLLLQLLIGYFVVLTFINQAVIVAIIVFGINSSAYMCEIIRGGLKSVDVNQYDAAVSLGSKPLKSIFDIILPQGLKICLPSICNELITNLKLTSLVGWISIIDLTQAATIISTNTFEYFLPLMIVAVVYV
ncbi:MAG: ABC transporter substrate-binding protein/permease, partial [Clostridia bacterium]|nr:ABC transporter substrate-binding protein/permease [Clostridia bacterium]